MSDSLERGENVVLRLPDGTPDGIMHAIGANSEWIRIETLDASQGDVPIKQLFDTYVHDPSATRRRTPSELVRQEPFQGLVIWLSGLNADSWAKWHEFLLGYQHAMRDMPENERTVFVAPLTGRDALLASDDEVGIVEHVWGQSHDRHDAIFLAKVLLEKRKLSTLHRRVSIAMLAELALWDEELAERLAMDGLHVLTAPTPILDEIRRERGWSDTQFAELDDRMLWATGRAAIVDGQAVHHLAAIPSDLRDREVSRRVWRAQVATCMPIIEEIRYAAIATYRRFLAPTMPHGRDRREALLDMEIGDIARQLKVCGDVPVEHRRLFDRLHRARNRLAHLQVVDWGDIPDEYPDQLRFGAGL